MASYGELGFFIKTCSLQSSASLRMLSVARSASRSVLASTRHFSALNTNPGEIQLGCQIHHQHIHHAQRQQHNTQHDAPHQNQLEYQHQRFL